MASDFLSTPRAEVMGLIGFLALATNVLNVLILVKYKTGDANVRSIWLCSRNDAIGNVAVMLAALGAWATATGWPDILVAAVLASSHAEPSLLPLAGGFLEGSRRLSMSYHFSKTLDVPFDQAITRVIETLKHEGFGVLTDIDVRATIKAKLDEDFRPYRILGACNPQLAFHALQLEDKIGTMLPCNVIVQEHADGTVEVSAVDPAASMQAIENSGLAEVAKEVQAKLRRVINGL
jgi:uncharacterized protein (DUF302 family)